MIIQVGEMKQILFLTMVLMVVTALLAGQAIQGDQEGNQRERADNTQGASSLGLTIFPKVPTSADIVEIRLNGGGEPKQALRATGTNIFFAEVLKIPERVTYTLGALAPGEYSFMLFLRVSDTSSCSHKLLSELSFEVQPAVPEGSGQVMLLVQGLTREGTHRLVEQEAPKMRWLFNNLAVLYLIPGLETSYRKLLHERPEIDLVELNSIGFIPECPPPLGPSFVPGSLLVSFKEGINRGQAEALVYRLPPQLEAFRALDLSVDAPALAKVSVPQNWEGLLLRRYLHHPEVIAGWVIPPRRVGSQALKSMSVRQGMGRSSR